MLSRVVTFFALGDPYLLTCSNSHIFFLFYRTLILVTENMRARVIVRKYHDIVQGTGVVIIQPPVTKCQSCTILGGGGGVKDPPRRRTCLEEVEGLKR